MFTLPANDIAVIGDTHQDTEWTLFVIKNLKRDQPHVRNYIQIGDFGLGVGVSGARFLQKVNKAMDGRKLFVLLGNHDNYDKYAKAVPSDEFPGTRVLQEAPNIHFFDRQAWFEMNGIKFLAVVGANSINREGLFSEDTKSGGVRFMKSWWAEEQITDEDVENAISGGKVDFLLSHDVPTLGFPLTEEEALVGRESWGLTATAYAEISGQQLQRVLEAVQPSVVIHGHYHKRQTMVAATDKSESLTVFESLGMNGDKKGNVILIKEDGNIENVEITH